MKNLTKQQVLDNLKASGVDLAGKPINRYLRDEQNKRHLAPPAPKPVAIPLTPQQAETAVAAAQAKRDQAQTLADQKAAESRAKFAENPFKALLDAPNTFSPAETKRFKQLAKTKDAENESAAAEKARVETLTSDPHYIRIVGSADRTIAMFPAEFKQEAMNLIAAIQADYDVAKYEAGRAELFARAKKSLDDKLAAARAESFTSSVEIAAITNEATKLAGDTPLESQS
jgi:hypothetical protein